jgi:Tol biopolymer transport system component
MALAALAVGFLLTTYGGTSRAAAPANSQRLEAANPSWSPDGTQIAFAYLGVPRGRVEVMSAAGGSGKHARYSADSCCEPVLWAADKRIAFASNFELFSIGEGSGKATKLFSGTPWFILSPNRETVALDDGCGCGHAPDSIALVSVRGGKPFVIARPKSTSDSINGFSPDGTQLVFTRAPWNYNGNPKGTPAIMVENIHLRGAPVSLARSGLIGSSHVPSNAVGPQWSPDGKWIAYVAPGAKPKLVLVSTAGGKPTVLASRFGAAAGFSWSPRSDRIAFTARATVKLANLVTVDLTGRQTVVSGSINWISDDSADRPQWSPDGSRLVFMGLVGPNVPGRPPAGVWIVDADGTNLRRLA